VHQTRRAAADLKGLAALGARALAGRAGTAVVLQPAARRARATPDATFVAGFKTWLLLGLAVKKGEKAIRIAPLPVKERDRTTGEIGVLFKTVFVFDRAQVAPIDGVEQAPLEPPREPLTGDSHAHLLAPSLGFTVSFQTIAGPAGGWCDQKDKRIVVAPGRPDSATSSASSSGSGRSIGKTPS
jgi:hypothetical protein